MNKKAIEKNLVKALLDDGAMASDLFAHGLEEYINEFLKSKHEDRDDYFFAVIGEAKDVAMLLIDSEDNVHENENARALLKGLWPQSAYKHNMQILIPQMADELHQGYIFVTGVKVQKAEK